MERIMQTKMNFAKGETPSASPPVEASNQIGMQDMLAVETPPSEMMGNKHEGKSKQEK